jgi:hypothetical protein
MPMPSKFTADRRQRILEALTIGAPLDVAAAIGGVERTTLQKWLQKGRAPGGPANFREFATQVDEAEAHPKARALGIIYKAMEDKPDLAWKFIERRVSGFAPPVAMPAVTHQPVKIQLSFHDGAAIAIADRFIEGEAVEQDETAPATILELPASARSSAS